MNSSMLNESYATAITLNNGNYVNQQQNPGKNRSTNYSLMQSEHSAATSNNGGNFLDNTAVEIINEYPLGIKKTHDYTLASPSRFKLGMYRKNLVLDPPRRHNLTLKTGGEPTGTYHRRAFSTEKKPVKVMDQYLNDYSNVRPGPKRSIKLTKSLKAGGKAASDCMYVASLQH